MKKLMMTAFAVALLLTALPGGAQDATPTPTASPTASPSASETLLPTDPSPSSSASPSASPSPSVSVSPSDGTAEFGQSTQPTQIYAGRTETRGVSITIGGQGLQAGVTTTNVASDTTEDCEGVACATAAGVAEPFGTTVTATSPGEGNPAPAEAGNLDPFEGGLAGQFGVATAMTTDQPSASGTSDALTVDVTLNQTILGNLPTDLTEPLNDGIMELTGALQPIADGDPTGSIQGLFDTLNGLIGNLQNSPLLRIQGGQTTSSSSFADGVVTASSESQGLILVILPTPQSTALVPEGLAVIEVGASDATATADGTNPATADATGSIARITLLPGILDALPDINPGESEGLPLEDILDMLPPEITDLLPEQVTGLLGGDASESPSPTSSASESESEDGPTGTPIDDIIPGSAFMQADDETGGFVIDLNTGSEQMCILEDTPLATCVTLGGTSESFSEDGLGVGVLAAGADISLLRDESGTGQVELSIARSEAGAAAGFTQATPTPIPTPTPQTGLPATGGGMAFLVPALALMALGGTALFGLRGRRRE